MQLSVNSDLQKIDSFRYWSGFYWNWVFLGGITEAEVGYAIFRISTISASQQKQTPSYIWQQDDRTHHLHNRRGTNGNTLKIPRIVLPWRRFAQLLELGVVECVPCICCGDIGWSRGGGGRLGGGVFCHDLVALQDDEWIDREQVNRRQEIIDHRPRPWIWREASVK